MQTIKGFEELLHEVNARTFDDIAIRLFNLQARENLVYAQYLRQLMVKPGDVKSISDIPFLPISFFKSHSVQTGVWQKSVTFSSSGTSGSSASQHSIPSLEFYLRHTQRIFENQLGPLSNYHLFALLPSYLERGGSSLIYMVEHFIRATGSTFSGFYLRATKDLVGRIKSVKAEDRRIILWGVTYALLDFAEQNPLELGEAIIMETGGMKGRRKELTREEVHLKLQHAFSVQKICSEYGMTELLSQAYSLGEGLFTCPPTMKVLAREVNDPFAETRRGQAGILKVIDLANIYSCAFIETQDLGRVHQNGNFEVLGRSDNSDARGCNLMVE